MKKLFFQKSFDYVFLAVDNKPKVHSIKFQFFDLV